MTNKYYYFDEIRGRNQVFTKVWYNKKGSFRFIDSNYTQLIMSSIVYIPGLSADYTNVWENRHVFLL